MANFVKGILVGLGAVAPGLSGSVLLVMFGLYRQTVAAISGLFRQPGKNLKYLLPLAGGIALGILLFSRLVDWLLGAWPMQTRFAFLGLILGSVPVFFREVRKEGFGRGWWLLIGACFATGWVLFQVNRGLFPPVTAPNVLQSWLLGVAVSTSYIVPGVDSAAILSALGMYDLWVHALATLNLPVLIPALFGALAGILVVSAVMERLLRRFYTPTFCVIFGLFLALIPSVLDGGCVLGWDWKSAVSLALFLAGLGASLAFGRLQKTPA